ncbi:MAG: glutaredoxin family protein [candidate division Zixibacteria bacterium]|nr:glutaredoxin family protein [candidate division Zixibacteria bacterium]MDD5425053.1 glutaredoxin family protein [candidate division Zixibacteria bacterium]
MPDVIIYTKTGCPYCSAAKKDLSDRGISFKEINVTDQPGYIPEVLKLTGGERIVPVIVQGDRVTKGFGGG